MPPTRRFLKVRETIALNATNTNHGNCLIMLFAFPPFVIIFIQIDVISWCIVIYVWTLLFGRNMFKKEASFERKKGGEEYMARSGLIIPKLF